MKAIYNDKEVEVLDDGNIFIGTDLLRIQFEGNTQIVNKSKLKILKGGKKYE